MAKTMIPKTPTMSRPYAIGLAGGALWMILVSAAYLIGALWALQLADGRALLSWSVGLGVTCLLFIAGIRFLRKGFALPHTYTPAASAQGRKLGWQFGVIVLSEALAIAVASNLCVWLHHEAWIVPMNLVIIGAHFIPLAWLFQVRAYLGLGLLWCFITLAAVFTTPNTLAFGPGQVSAWIILPVIGCVLSTWVVIALLLRWAHHALPPPRLPEVH